MDQINCSQFISSSLCDACRRTQLEDIAPDASTQQFTQIYFGPFPHLSLLRKKSKFSVFQNILTLISFHSCSDTFFLHLNFFTVKFILGVSFYVPNYAQPTGHVASGFYLLTDATESRKHVASDASNPTDGSYSLSFSICQVRFLIIFDYFFLEASYPLPIYDKTLSWIAQCIIHCSFPAF